MVVAANNRGTCYVWCLLKGYSGQSVLQITMGPVLINVEFVISEFLKFCYVDNYLL